MQIAQKLDEIAHSLEEARAAAQVIADGDPSALAELDAEVDRMAEGIAELKALTAGPPGA